MQFDWRPRVPTEEGVYSVKVHGCSYAYDYEERAVDVLDCLYERSKNLMRYKIVLLLPICNDFGGDG